MPAGALKLLPVLPAHTVLAPPILQVGVALTVTVLLQVDVQPLAFVRMTVTVNVPAVVAFTLTVCALLGPLMVPLPEMLQA